MLVRRHGPLVPGVCGARLKAARQLANVPSVT
jgi:hypothetical protein